MTRGFCNLQLPTSTRIRLLTDVFFWVWWLLHSKKREAPFVAFKELSPVFKKLQCWLPRNIFKRGGHPSHCCPQRMKELDASWSHGTCSGRYCWWFRGVLPSGGKVEVNGEDGWWCMMMMDVNFFQAKTQKWICVHWPREVEFIDCQLLVFFPEHFFGSSFCQQFSGGWEALLGIPMPTIAMQMCWMRSLLMRQPSWGSVKRWKIEPKAGPGKTISGWTMGCFKMDVCLGFTIRA